MESKRRAQSLFEPRTLTITHHIMFVTKCALPLCMLFLCAAGDAQHGLCEDNKCFALFLESRDFAEAQRSCRDTGGQLYDAARWGKLPALPVSRGIYWIHRAVQKEEETCTCVAVYAKQVRFHNCSCTERQDGFMCQFSISSTCRALPVSGGAHVNYTTAWGFEVRAVFPVGTVAVVRAPGYPPDSKHVCLGTQWQQVPWRCEVMNGGCEHACNASTGACTCPAGQYLHYNNFTCTENPCASCRGHCVNNGGSWECLCKKGFKLGAGGRCVDVDECAEDRTLCSDPGQECVNLDGSYQCQCQDDYDLEDGVCVDVSICLRCEQNCEVLQGTAVCNCSKGFRVSPVNPTKCEQYCDEQDCPSKCERDQEQCYCPEGYIQDLRDEGVVCTDINECDVETQCQHHCENFFGGFRCLCEAGFQLQKNYLCVPKEDGSGLDPVYPTASGMHPTVVPSYVRTGSVLGITVFALLCVGLFYVLVQSLVRRCSRVQLYSLKRDMDIFTLQQVSTETYKRLSCDRQFRTESHRL